MERPDQNRHKQPLSFDDLSVSQRFVSGKQLDEF